MPEFKQPQPVKRNKKKKKPVLKIILTVLIILLLAFGSYAFYLYYVGKKAADNAYDSNSRGQSELRDTEVTPLEDNISILFVGIDDSEKRDQGKSNSRSDALMVATLNNDEKSVKLLSIPRDSYVYVPEFGYEDKITHAHTASTGVNSTIDTVEEMLNIPVDYYFELNFDAFIQIVDALGGIEVDVPYELDELDENDKRTIHLEPGVQTVNGSEALALARTRHYDNDFKRGERQQMILEAIVEKATSVTSFTKYASLLNAVGDNMTTNMSFGEMQGLFIYLTGGMPDIDSLKLEGTDDTSTGVYYFKVNDESMLNIRQTLQKHLGLSIDQSLIEEDGTIKELDGTTDGATDGTTIQEPSTTDGTTQDPSTNNGTTDESTNNPYDNSTDDSNVGTPDDYNGSTDYSGNSNNGNGDYSGSNSYSGN